MRGLESGRNRKARTTIGGRKSKEGIKSMPVYGCGYNAQGRFEIIS